MKAHCDSAMTLARFLSGHGLVEKVHYPGLPDHPGHQIAKAQMPAFGGMLSFEVGSDAASALAVAARLKLITRATSLGGPHSLIEHRASVEGPETSAPPGLLRLSVGLEDVDDLIDDLRQAL
jgi:cystathionine gamma-synthase